MALNETYTEADSIPVTVPSGVVSGDPVVVGKIVGVAIADRGTDGKVALRRRGAYRLTVTGAINEGDIVYAVTSAGLVTSLTATVGSNTVFGLSMTTQAATGKCDVIIGYP